MPEISHGPEEAGGYIYEVRDTVREGLGRLALLECPQRTEKSWYERLGFNEPDVEDDLDLDWGMRHRLAEAYAKGPAISPQLAS